MNENEINEGDVKTTFFILISYVGDIEEPTTEDPEGIYMDLPKIYDKARFGIIEKFDIYDFIYEIINFQKIKTGKVIYRGKSIPMSNFWTELEARNTLMKKWLKENVQQKGIVDHF
jgi:hypothetical protein